MLEKVASYLTTGVGNIFTSTFTILSQIGGSVVADGTIFYLCALPSGLQRTATPANPGADLCLLERKNLSVAYAIIFTTANEIFTKFIIGQCTEALIIGVLCALGMALLLRFPYAAMVGTLVGVTALLPILGAYLGAFIGAFMVFTVNPSQALGFLLFIVILQQIEGNLIYPRCGWLFHRTAGSVGTGRRHCRRWTRRHLRHFACSSVDRYDLSSVPKGCRTRNRQQAAHPL